MSRLCNIVWNQKAWYLHLWSSFIRFSQFNSIQSLSRVQHFATPWTSTYQSSLSITNSQSLLKLMSIESWWCHTTISSSVVPFSFCLQSFPPSGSFPMSQFLTPGGQSIEVSASITESFSFSWSWCSNTLATWCKELIHWKWSWFWERLKAWGEGLTEDDIMGWHHQLDGHEFEQALGVGDGQGSLACCSPWGCKGLNTTEWLNWIELIM